MSIIFVFQLLSVMISVAFYTQLERKVLGYTQSRKGPNKPGLLGLFVPLADALKLMLKEYSYPGLSNKSLFMLMPCLALLLPLLLWIVYPTPNEVLRFNFSVLWIVCVSAVGVYAILGSGWSSNSKYPMLGAVRAVAQSISYEVCLTLILLLYILFYLFRLFAIKTTPLSLFMFVPMILLFVASLAETNRSPFDFSEGESELVSGFNTEFSSVPFVMIFLAEYMSILFMTVMVSAVFNMSDFLDMMIFVVFWAVLFIWSRGTLPRFRYDQLMYAAWKSFLPFILCSVCFYLFV